ncbi:MAG: ribonuclease HII [bacterium]
MKRLIKKKLDVDERLRIEKMLCYERELWRQGSRHVAGLDEAGRGPLAGPVVAAAVIFRERPDIPMIDDSKKLSHEIREYLYDLIRKEALVFGVGVAQVDEIDRINIYQASFLAMDRAVEKLAMRPDHLLVDGRSFLREDIPFTTIVKGDSLSCSIAAASVLAKVTRDRMMLELDQEFPQYGFANHKGYATREHLDAIEKFGYCPVHRRSFHPKRFQLELDFDA